jgi:hypothetical protein
VPRNQRNKIMVTIIIDIIITIPIIIIIVIIATIIIIITMVIIIIIIIITIIILITLVIIMIMEALAPLAKMTLMVNVEMVVVTIPIIIITITQIPVFLHGNKHRSIVDVSSVTSLVIIKRCALNIEVHRPVLVQSQSNHQASRSPTHQINRHD